MGEPEESAGPAGGRVPAGDAAPAGTEGDLRPGKRARMRYGADFTFAHRAARAPVHWPADRPITVRAVGSAARLADGVSAALSLVLPELRALTGYDLLQGAPGRAAVDLAAIPDGEIHVCYARAAVIAAAQTHCADGAGIGGGSWDAGAGLYLAGFAVLNADLVADAASGQALALLRHELGHALGLGHAARPHLVMHYRLAPGALAYGPGDRHGLTLLGRISRAAPAAPARSGARTPPCAL